MNRLKQKDSNNNIEHDRLPRRLRAALVPLLAVVAMAGGGEQAIATAEVRDTTEVVNEINDTLTNFDGKEVTITVSESADCPADSVLDAAYVCGTGKDAYVNIGADQADRLLAEGKGGVLEALLADSRAIALMYHGELSIDSRYWWFNQKLHVAYTGAELRALGMSPDEAKTSFEGALKEYARGSEEGKISDDFRNDMLDDLGYGYVKGLDGVNDYITVGMGGELSPEMIDEKTMRSRVQFSDEDEKVKAVDRLTTREHGKTISSDEPVDRWQE